MTTSVHLTALDTALAERAQQRLVKAIKLLQEADASIPPGGPRRETQAALDSAYAAWRILRARYSIPVEA